MLNIRNLHITFNPGTVNANQVFDGLDLSIAPGEFVTVIGGNGSGKSTLMNLIAGVYMPDNGQILIDGHDVTYIPEHKRARYLGRVFQDPLQGTAGDMMIEENMAMAALRGSSRGLKWNAKRQDEERFQKLLSSLDLGLESRMKQKVRLLSGGQRQALTLLMATMNQPNLLLLDEHTAALDPKTAAKVMEVTERVVREKQLTTLMITHNMQQAIQYGDRLLMMSAGKLVLDIKGDDKKRLTVEDLLRQFSAKTAHNSDAVGDLGDRMLLS